jgi:4'-phosphopantetheinyl transferase EntD
VLDEILPVEVAVAEAFGDPPEAVLYPEEEPAVARAVDKRRREYTTGRYCARRALGRLGLPLVAIPTGPDRAPTWPPGVVGSITHCAGYRAAAVAHARHLAALGIDAEPHEPLPEGVLGLVALPTEQTRLAELARESPGVHWDRLLFSAKESVYKAWYPLARRWLGFEEAELALEPAAFTARLLVPGPEVGGRPLSTLAGRWLVRDGLVVTAIAVPA